MMSTSSGAEETIFVQLKPEKECCYKKPTAADIRKAYGMEADAESILVSDVFMEGIDLAVQKRVPVVYKPLSLDISALKEEESIQMQKSIRKARFIQKSLLDEGLDNGSLTERLISGSVRKCGSCLMERSVVPEYGKAGRKVDFSTCSPYLEIISTECRLDVYIETDQPCWQRRIVETGNIELHGIRYCAQAEVMRAPLNLCSRKAGILMGSLLLREIPPEQSLEGSIFRASADPENGKVFLLAGSSFPAEHLKQIMECSAGPVPPVMWIGAMS